MDLGDFSVRWANNGKLLGSEALKQIYGLIRKELIMGSVRQSTIFAMESFEDWSVAGCHGVNAMDHRM